MPGHPNIRKLSILDGNNIWDRQKGEPEKAFQTFTLYREMGHPRSVKRLAKQLGRRAHRRFELWSAKWDWPKRAEAYDDELDRRYQASTAGEIERMAKRHKAIAQRLQWISNEELIAIENRIKQAKKEEARTKKPRAPVLKTVSEIRRFGKEGAILERLIVGEPTELPGKVEESEDSPDFSKLSTEELIELKRLQDKARKA
jgi:hypothetical protein